jgi:hypothetical protein
MKRQKPKGRGAIELTITKQSRIEWALTRIPMPAQGEAGEDSDELFDVQHLTSADIGQLEDAPNTMDLEVMVATIEAIVGRHRASTKRMCNE